jgi:predicted RecA/RadA family phage recombinase
MADYLPKFKPGASVTFTTTADVIGGRLVEVGATVRSCTPAAADSAKVLGVAATDATSGNSVGVYLRPTGVQQLVASAAIAVGAKVVAATGGKVQTIGANSNPIGIALEAAAADLDVIDVLFI